MYCAWQRGIVENTNRLYRYFFAKEKSFAYVSDEGIVSITIMIHTTPGKSNVWKSLYEVL